MLGLGQLAHGNPIGEYETLPYQDALVLSLLDEIGRVFWNKNQREWDRYEDPKLVGVVFRPYYWGENEEESALPNLAFIFSGQEIRWYKYPGRGMTVTQSWAPQEWAGWYESAYQLINANDEQLF